MENVYTEESPVYYIDGTSKVEEVGRDWGPLLGLLENWEEE